MKINLQTYKDKVHACWIGKNIGGTIGGPYEGKREFLDVKGFVTEQDVVLPNDDLDLQLVWLRAVEIHGARAVTPQLLGEFWLSFVTPHWGEYGICKNNMRIGFYPPFSGDVFNSWKNSNGAWIRTEIWACLAPGAPEIATKYAYRDACIDHGVEGEGTIAAVFVAALESAAFVEKDIRKLIDIGLSYIPENSRFAKSIRKVIECYEEGKDYKTARNIILELNKDIGNGWFEAPSNVSYAVIGLLWGQGDFKKSMIYAVNCGDDTDCTAGTVGSILGIIGGTKGIPEDWKAHIGDKIATVSIAVGVLKKVPETCKELTERVAKVCPGMLFENNADVSLTEGEEEVAEDFYEKTLKTATTEIFNKTPYSYTVEFLHTDATVVFESEPKIQPLQTYKIKIIFEQKYLTDAKWCVSPYYLKLRWWLPEGFTVNGANVVCVEQYDPHANGKAEAEFEIIAPQTLQPVNRLVLEAEAIDKMTVGYIPVTLLG